MLTDKPNIVIAHAPKYTRHKRKTALAVPTRVVGGGSKVAELSETERDQRADAADLLFQEIKPAVAVQRSR